MSHLDAPDEIERLQARVAELSNRLEITHVWRKAKDSDDIVRAPTDEPLPQHLDGISCRDETIRMQDEQLALARSSAQRRAQLLRRALVLLPELGDAMELELADDIRAELGPPADAGPQHEEG